jgi:hypothetical protein
MFSSEPVILVGEPQRLRGKINLTNSGAEDMVLQGGQFRTPAKKLQGKAVQRQLDINQPLHPIIVRSGRSRSISVKMALDPFTPPGEYDAELEVGGQTKPVKLHIIEKIDLSVHPDKLIIREVPGATVTKRIIVTNNGNVPLTIGEIGAVVLEDERLECRVMRRVLAAIDTNNKEAELEDYLRTAIAQAQSVLQEAGALRVHNKTGNVSLEPGSTLPIDLEIQLPESLDKRTRYTAVIGLYNENLIFEIAPAFGNLPNKVKR